MRLYCIVPVLSQDRSLVDLLASLADDSCPSGSQHAAVELEALAEGDSLLASMTGRPGSGEGTERLLEEGDDDVESLEMSQRIWDDQEQG